MPDRVASTPLTDGPALSGFPMADGTPETGDVADLRARPGQASPGMRLPDTNRFDLIGQGDFVAGVVASVSLLLLVFTLDLSLWLAIPLAVATYAGVTLLRPRHVRAKTTGDEAHPEYQAHQTALANAAAIRAIGQRIARPAMRDQVDRIADRIDLILATMREDGNLAAAPLFNEQLLEPFDSLLIEYVRLASRGVRSAEGLIDKTERYDLPMIEQAVDAFCEQLNRAHVVDLEALGGVLELNLRSIAPRSPEEQPAKPTAPATTSAISPRTADLTAPNTLASAAAAQIGLTRREIEFLPLLAQRLTDREIAERLCISPRTAMNHTASILAKLGLTSRREVADFATERGLLPTAAPKARE